MENCSIIIGRSSGSTQSAHWSYSTSLAIQFVSFALDCPRCKVSAVVVFAYVSMEKQNKIIDATAKQFTADKVLLWQKKEFFLNIWEFDGMTLHPIKASEGIKIVLGEITSFGKEIHNRAFLQFWREVWNVLLKIFVQLARDWNWSRWRSIQTHSSVSRCIQF